MYLKRTTMPETLFYLCYRSASEELTQKSQIHTHTHTHRQIQSSLK